MAEGERGTVISDPRVLRAIAHPARLRILDEFSARGAMRAADIARILDIPANQASFHLRQLAKYGLLAEAPEEARDARDRVWKLDHTSLSVNTDELSATPAGRVAADLFKRQWADRVHRALDSLMLVDESTAKHTYRGMDSSLFLTDDEARSALDELAQVLDRWREKGQGSSDPDARTYHIVLLAHPEEMELREERP